MSVACAVPADRVSDSSGIASAVGGKDDHSGVGAAVREEAEAAHPQRTGGGAVEVVVAHRVAHGVRARARGLREAVPRGRRVDQHGGAERPDREAVAVRLLPHEPALVRAAARERGGGHVDVALERNRDAGKHRPPETSRPGDSFLGARESAHRRTEE